MIGSLGSMALVLLLVPVAFILIFAGVLLPSLSQAGAKPLGVGKALYCYLMQFFGLTLMTIGAIPALKNVLTNTPTSTNNYIGYLVLFAVGGLVFLLHEHMVAHVDEASRSIPHAIYFFSLKAIGFLVTVAAALGLLLAMLFGYTSDPTWWVMPTLLLCYGLLLSCCTRMNMLSTTAPTVSKSTTMPMSPSMPMTASVARPPIVGAKPMIMPSNRLTMTPADVKPMAAPAPAAAPAKRSHKKKKPPEHA